MGRTIPKTSAEVRSSHLQKKVRSKSKSAYLDQKEATHFLGCGVAVALNRTLPGFAQRTAPEIRRIMNGEDNLALHLKKTNQDFHKKVDNLLLNPPRCRPLNRDEYNRVGQITRRVQASPFQERMRANGGKQLYLAVRGTIQGLNTGDRPSLWDARHDHPALQRRS